MSGAVTISCSVTLIAAVLLSGCTLFGLPIAVQNNTDSSIRGTIAFIPPNGTVPSHTFDFEVAGNDREEIGRIRQMGLYTANVTVNDGRQESVTASLHGELRAWFVSVNEDAILAGQDVE